MVWAAALTAALGPIEHYPNAKAMTGRAGLLPRRYQSAQVDQANGRLARRAHRRLRGVRLGIADTLIACNQHCGALAAPWRALGQDPRHRHVKIALRFARIACSMVAGRQVFRHPCRRQRQAILDKRRAFHRAHDTPWPQTLADRNHTVPQLPVAESAAEARPLAERLPDFTRAHPGPGAATLGRPAGHGAGPLGGGSGTIKGIRAEQPHVAAPGPGRERLGGSQGSTPRYSVALSRISNA